jgi:hypothetical protein
VRPYRRRALGFTPYLLEVVSDLVHRRLLQSKLLGRVL